LHIIYDNKTYFPDGDADEWKFVKAKCRSTVLMVLTALEVTYCTSVMLAKP